MASNTTQLRFDDRVIIVTGAGRGMGAAHSLELARRGACVLVNDLGGDVSGRSGAFDPGPADSVVEVIRAEGGVATANYDSVATAQGCEAIVAAAVEGFGRIDGVVHNAGIVDMVEIGALDEARFEAMLRVHLYGAFNLTRAAWPQLAEHRGRVVYISSGAGIYGSPGMGHYASAKSGMIGLGRVAAAEGAASGIAVNVLAVAAGTRMIENVMAHAPNTLAWFGRYMAPELPTAPLLWLLHPDCPATGRAFQAFGGHVAEIFTGETRGYTKLDLTPEDVRDHFGAIEDRTEHIELVGVLGYHERMVEFMVEAGAEAPLHDHALDV
jgi:NAD(P)-dependent dehydrogenase (short-subunit alcohol dehydrogenase family)